MKSLLITLHDGIEINHYYSFKNRDYIGRDDEGTERNGPEYHEINSSAFAFVVTPDMITDLATVEMMHMLNPNGSEEIIKYSIRIGNPMDNEYILDFTNSTIALDYYKKFLSLKYDDVEDYLEEHPEYEI